jgi:GMP synthase PP-ATPase subunit
MVAVLRHHRRTPAAGPAAVTGLDDLVPICLCGAIGLAPDVRVIRVNAAARFLAALKGEADPERKRKIIGGLFVEVFEEESRKLEGVRWLAQGTIYPDVVESAGAKTGKAHVIKSHHNVGGLPEHMKLGLVEPLRAVETMDFMTARWARLPYEFLDICARRIINEVKGNSRVTYDISGKPPATIEWE